MHLRPITRSFMATLESYERLNPPPRLALTTESIAFQRNDMFGPNLETIVSKYEDLVSSGANQKAIKAATELHTSLEMLIKARLGIKVKLIINSHLAAVIPNVYVPHNPMIRDKIRSIYEVFDEIGAQDKLAELKNKTIIGTVNTETAKVSGWFSEQELPIYINFKKLFASYKMTVPEVTAVILHELGHAFEAIVFSSNINTTNQVLADISRHITSKDRGGDVDYIYSRVKEISPNASRDIAEGLASGNRVVMSIATYRLYNDVVTSLMTNNVYDRTGFEAIADNFTSRFNYGLQIVMALEKLEAVGSSYDFDKKMFMDLSTVMFITGLGTFMYTLLIFTTASLFPALMATLFGYLTKILFDTQRPSQKEMVYDNIKDRYLRIRAQVVEMIKDPELDKNTREVLLEQIKTLDEIIGNKRVFTSWMTKFAAYVIPSDRRTAESIARQQELEALIANDIFVAANRLKATA